MIRKDSIKKSKKSTKSKLVKRYLEHKKREDYKKALGKRNRGRGIYVLYKGEKPYYIGLSETSLRDRLRRHATKDRHSKLDKNGKKLWDEYSFYQIGRTRFIKDIESLILRISHFPGNERKGRFKRKYDLGRKKQF